MIQFKIKPLSSKDRAWATSLLCEQWGSSKIVSRGKITDADQLPGYIAFADNKYIGLITYEIEHNECEIVSLNSLQEGIGIGSGLVQAVLKKAKELQSDRVWLVTTNDNLPALRFYQKRGFELVCIHRNAIEASRKLKPQIPLLGIDDIPLKDEIEVEYKLK